MQNLFPFPFNMRVSKSMCVSHNIIHPVCPSSHLDFCCGGHVWLKPLVRPQNSPQRGRGVVSTACGACVRNGPRLASYPLCAPFAKEGGRTGFTACVQKIKSSRSSLRAVQRRQRSGVGVGVSVSVFYAARRQPSDETTSPQHFQTKGWLSAVTLFGLRALVALR